MEKDQRLKDKEKNHKGGIYDGKSSGQKYENMKINEYMKSHSKKQSRRSKNTMEKKGVTLAIVAG